MDAWVDSSAALLHRQLSHAFGAARWQVAGLTDDEYFWEPHPRCWSVRRRSSAVSAAPSGIGEWVTDGEWPPSGEPPITTIAWRLMHLAAWTEVYRNWTFDDATRSYDDIEVPDDADAAVRLLHVVQGEFSDAVAPLGDRDLMELRRAHWGDEYPIGALVWQIAVEHLHHSAEIGVLRDLRRGHARSEWWPEPVASP
jgi:DinB superfamily